MLQRIKNFISVKTVLSAILTINLVAASSLSLAMTHVMVDDDEPSILAKYTDLLVLRPVGIVTTVIGAAAFVVALPFTAATGDIKKTGKTLVADPALFTFFRCLGCTRTGYQHEVKEEMETQ